jgi:GNAT superfamily N-acetyltransferase
VPKVFRRAPARGRWARARAGAPALPCQCEHQRRGRPTGARFRRMINAVAFREIASDDIDELAAAVADAFVGYRVFAPADWQPPPASEQAGVLQRWIADRDFWGELAAEQRTLVGHATFIPAARHSFRPTPDPSVAHLGHLFVKPEYWGSGLAAELLARATGAAAARGGGTQAVPREEGGRGCIASSRPAPQPGAPAAPAPRRSQPLARAVIDEPTEHGGLTRVLLRRFRPRRGRRLLQWRGLPRSFGLPSGIAVG